MNTLSQHLEAIPQPKEKPLVGNLFEIESGKLIQSMMRLAHEYGPIYRLNLVGQEMTVVSSFSLVDEVCDDTRFDKDVRGVLSNLRPIAHDGLFTAKTEEPNWRKAHNILLPNFGMKAMRGYLPMMVEIAEQLMGKWDRANPNDEIDVAGDLTRLTLDTIALCGFDYRFNSFYRESTLPFVQSMSSTLAEGMARATRAPLATKLMLNKQRQFEADRAFMYTIVDGVIKGDAQTDQDPG